MSSSKKLQQQITEDYPVRRKAQSIVLRLPPYSYLPSGLKSWLSARSVLATHLWILTILYSFLGLSSLKEHTFFIRGGIGIVQNPPFLSHLLFGSLSIPIILYLAKRVVRLGVNNERTIDKEAAEVIKIFFGLIRKSKAKNVLFSIAFLVGLFALAYTLALSASYRASATNIYDSFTYPWTAIAYFLVRIYLYLLCYPISLAAVPTITYHFFRALGKSQIPYRPFHHDQTGGLRKFFVAVDRPVYAVQSCAVLVALMNYFGWHGMKLVPMILAIGAPVVVTLLALFLFIHFGLVMKAKKADEIREICQQGMDLYILARKAATISHKECLELLERIEAIDRLTESIRRSKRKDLTKYAFNVAVLIVPQLFKPVGEAIAQRFLGAP